MSSSSLTNLSSTSSDVLPSFTAPRQARTYGRPRPQEEPIVLAPSAPYLSKHPASPPSSPPATNHSPAKALLNRWAGNNTSWRESLAKLDAPSSQGRESDDEDDIEEIKKAMERMKREARGEFFPEPVAPVKGSVEVSAPASEGLKIPSTRLGISFSDSSLTDLPTSSLPSSPPRQDFAKPAALSAKTAERSSEAGEETFPIRKSGARSNGKQRQIIESGDENSDDAAIPNPSRKAPARIIESSPPSPAASTSSSESLTDKAGHRTSSPRQDKFDQFVSTLGDATDEDSDEDKPVNGKNRSTPTADPVDLFDDEEESHQSKKKGKSKGIKPLSKKDKEEMYKDMAKAKRDRPVAPAKIRADPKPITNWVLGAAQVVKDTALRGDRKMPTLSYSSPSAVSSPLHPTPVDEIKSFSPSSSGRPKSEMLEGTAKVTFEHPSSSPTPQAARKSRETITVIPATSEEADNDVLPDLSDMLRQDREKEEKQRLWAERKAAAVKAQGAKPIPKISRPTSKPDDELDFEESPVKPRKTVRIAPDARKSDGRLLGGRAGLIKVSDGPPASRQQRTMLNLAGRPSRPKDTSTLTETYVEHAGKTFKHADIKFLNGGAVQAGQKKGRDEAIAKERLDAMSINAHLAQVRVYQRTREQAWGRLKALPAKQEIDADGLVEMAKAVGGQNDLYEDEEDEDEEDDDFVPEGQEDEEEEGDVTMRYSGEESEGEVVDEEGPLEQEGTPEPGSEDKENQPPPMSNTDVDDEEDDTPIIRRRPRTKARVAFDSDDEDIVSQSRIPLASKPNTPTITPTKIKVPSQIAGATSEPEIDLGGFGGSFSFSQLFGETQVGDDDTDGFAGLRAQPQDGLLPSHLMLPDVQISKTQAQRDNALIAAELDDAEQAEGSSQPTRQYLNDQGFFTQTRPVAPSATQMSEDESQLFAVPLERSESNISIPGYSESMTETSSHPEDPTFVEPVAREIRTPSPTQDGETFTRLKRRTTPDFEAPTSLSPSPRESEPAPNAFQTLMAAARQPKAKSARPVKSNLIEEQAEESDEDIGWAPAGGDKEDEGEDGDDDGFLEDLVDDQVVAEEEKKRQDELAAEKAREDQRLDDLKREEKAKKITAGELRVKKRGQDFFSDDEEDEDGNPRMSKKQRRKRRLEGVDELQKLEGEQKAFLHAYEQDLESDVSDIDDASDQEEEKAPKKPSVKSRDEPERDPLHLLRERARMNRNVNLDDQNRVLDEELEYGSGLGNWEIDDVVEETQFSISKGRVKISTQVEHDEHSLGPLPISRQSSTRSMEHLEKYITEESQMNRRAGGTTGGISVVSNKTMLVAPTGGKGNGYMGGNRNKQNFAQKSSSTSILMQKTKNFAS